MQIQSFAATETFSITRLLKKLKKNAELDWNHLKSGATAICGLEGEV
jgi:hypothetical protein